MLPSKQVSKADWFIPAGLLAISFIAVVVGVLRMAQLAAGTSV